MAGIYIHIPFCKCRCAYCNFFSTTSLDERERYVSAVKKELSLRKDYLKGEKVETIYFGGGTPSQLPPGQLTSILTHIYKVYDVSDNAEITAEGNPDDLSEDYLHDLRRGGFNRLSMGIQTFDNARLRFIRRRHTAEEAALAVERAKEMGFQNISIDLIYGFPNETIEAWETDVDKAAALGVQHVSAYALTFEEGTPLHAMLTKGEVEEISEEESLRMYETLMDKLKQRGFEHYEISNFALPGYHSRHNSSYWEGVPYLGAGAAAHSFDKESRQWNPSSLSEYIHGIESEKLTPEREHLTMELKYDEHIMTRLRTRKGLSLKSLREEFGKEKSEYCLRLAQPHIGAGLLKYDSQSEILRVSRKGLFVSDDIISDLMSDES